MRFSFILFGYLFLINSLAWSQEVAIDIPVNRLSSRPMTPLAETDQLVNPTLLAETGSKLQLSESKHSLSAHSDHLTHATTLCYQKIRRIVYEAPLIWPHFLTRSELPRCGIEMNIADKDRSIAEKLSSGWQPVY